MSDPLPPKLAQGCWWASVSLTSPAYPIVLSQSGDPGSVLLAQCQCKAQSTATHSHKADAQAHVYTSLQCTLNHAWGLQLSGHAATMPKYTACADSTTHVHRQPNTPPVLCWIPHQLLHGVFSKQSALSSYNSNSNSAKPPRSTFSHSMPNS